MPHVHDSRLCTVKIIDWSVNLTPQSCGAVMQSAEIHLRESISPRTSHGCPVVRWNNDGVEKTARDLCSSRVVIGGSIVRNAVGPREVVRAAVKGQREKKGAGVPEREVARFFPTAWKTNPPPAGYRGGRRRWRRCGRDARRAAGATKRGGEEGYPGWSRWWLGAAASKIHRNHTARLHRRSRHLPPPNRNETARVKHPILLPPSRSCPATRWSNGQVKNHHRRDCNQLWRRRTLGITRDPRREKISDRWWCARIKIYLADRDRCFDCCKFEISTSVFTNFNTLFDMYI